MGRILAALRALESGDGFQDFFTGAERNTQLFQVGFVELRQGRQIDLLLVEETRVLREPQTFQPFCNFLAHGPEFRFSKTALRIGNVTAIFCSSIRIA